MWYPQCYVCDIILLQQTKHAHFYATINTCRYCIFVFDIHTKNVVNIEKMQMSVSTNLCAMGSTMCGLGENSFYEKWRCKFKYYLNVFKI